MLCALNISNLQPIFVQQIRLTKPLRPIRTNPAENERVISQTNLQAIPLYLPL